jgi:hypothetical protein
VGVAGDGRDPVPAVPRGEGADDAGAANIIARLFGDKDGKSAATIENLIGMFRNFGPRPDGRRVPGGA